MKSIRRLPVLLAVALGTMIVIGLLVRGMRQKRTVFYGHTASVSKLRCRFTLASDWKSPQRETTPGFVDLEDFAAPPPAKVKRWIMTTLLHRSDSSKMGLHIYLTSLEDDRRMHYLQIKEGYPELLTTPPPPYSYAHRHLKIDGCPATFITSSAPSLGHHTVLLLVHAPGTSLSYLFSGNTDTDHASELDHEMQAILNSFHIEKVTAH